MSHDNPGRLVLVTAHAAEAQRGEETASRPSAGAEMGTQVSLLPREFLLLTLLGLWHQEKEHGLC